MITLKSPRPRLKGAANALQNACGGLSRPGNGVRGRMIHSATPGRMPDPMPFFPLVP